METRMYRSYEDFLNRADKLENGVSIEFSIKKPNYKKDNGNNRGCWNCSGCSDCSYCSYCSGCFGCSGCSDCSDCSGCSDCFGCSDCSYCSYCSYCSDCSYCFYCSNCSYCSYCSGCFGCSGCSDCSDCLENDKNMDAPKIKDIHSEVLRAAARTRDSLEMSSWHTCNTTHCRAGWVVTLAGEAGRELEKQTSTLFAAMQIYKKSSDIKVSPVRFFDSNEKALEDMKRCAQLEIGELK